MQPDSRFLMAYCERLGQPAFWAEPLNAITNGAFILAAIAGFWLWWARGRRDIPSLLLIGITMLIGIGSFLFHTIPNRTTVMLDVLPIQAFILLYFGLALRRYLALPLWEAILGPLVFLVVSAGIVEFVGSRTLRGGIGYLPALAALFVFAYLVGRRQDDLSRRRARGLVLAGLIFTGSLAFRTLDMPLCGVWPVGLHFLWHLLNAVVLGTLIVTALQAATKTSDRPA